MAHRDDYTDNFPPWGKRDRIVPLRTYSGKVVYRRKVHYFKMEDATRILAKVSPPNDADDTWFVHVIRLLREATISMLSRLLPFLPRGALEEIYLMVYEIIDKWLRTIGLTDDAIRKWAVKLIDKLAMHARVDVKIEPWK